MSSIQVGGSEVKAGDRLVYPNGGLVRVKGVETTVIGGKPWSMLVLTREEDGAVIRVMPEKLTQVGLRKVADKAAIELLFEFLKRSSTGPELDWKVRHKENFERMSAGGMLEHAEILKGLHALAKVRPLPSKERELYNNVRHLLITEIAASWGIPLAVAENNIDYALNPPPGSGREAPSDEPLDVKRLRRMLGGTRKSVAGGSDELGLDDDAEDVDDDADDEEGADGEGAPAEGGEDSGGEGGDEAPAKPAKAAKKSDVKTAAKKVSKALGDVTLDSKMADAILKKIFAAGIPDDPAPPKKAAPVDDPKPVKKAAAKVAAKKADDAPKPSTEKKTAAKKADAKKVDAKKTDAKKAAPARKPAKGGKS